MGCGAREKRPCGGICGGERAGVGGGLAGEVRGDADDEGVVLVVLVEDGELGGEDWLGRSRLDRVITV